MRVKAGVILARNRVSQGMTVEALAGEARVSPHVVWRAEHGQRITSAEHERIADALWPHRHDPPSDELSGENLEAFVAQLG